MRRCWPGEMEKEREETRMEPEGEIMGTESNLIEVDSRVRPRWERTNSGSGEEEEEMEVEMRFLLKWPREMSSMTFKREATREV